MDIDDTDTFSHSGFLTQLNQLFDKDPQQQKAVDFYAKYLIPFEQSLQKKTIPFEGETQSKNKIEGLIKLEKVEADLKEMTSGFSQTKINLEIMTLDRDRIDIENRTLRMELEEAEGNVKSLSSSLDEKLSAIMVSEEDKKHLVSQIEERSKEYNLLYESFMRDKNMLVTKLNDINEMEERILERQRKLEEDQFYLQNEKKKFEDSKKDMVERPKEQKKQDLNSAKLISVEEYQKQQREEEEDAKKDSKKEIARNPIKKIVKHHTSQIYCISSSYNGNILATCGGDRLIKFYDPFNFKTVSQVSSNSPQSVFTSLHLNHFGEKLIAGSTDKTVTLWDVQQGKQMGCYMGHGEKVNAVSFTNMKEKCVSGSNDRQLKVWDIEKGSNTLSVNCGKSVKVVSPNYSEPIVYTGLADGSVRIYSINQGTSPLTQIKGIIDYPITSITLSSNRNQLLVGSQEGSSLCILDIRTSKLLKKFEDKEFFNGGENFNADYTPSEKYVLAGNYEGAILYWNVETQKREAKLTGHEGTVTSVVYQPFTGIMSSTDSKGNMILWN